MIKILKQSFGLQEETIIHVLPFVLSEIRAYTGQYFLTEVHTKVTHIDIDGIHCEENPIDFIVGDIIELLNSNNNSLLYTIKAIVGNIITTDQALDTELTNTNIVMIKLNFRGVSPKTVSDMIGYSTEMEKQLGIKSQTLGGYNVTWSVSENGTTMFPLELYGGINSLRKMNDDYAEYWRKGYVRI